MKIYHSILILLAVVGSVFFLVHDKDSKAIYFLLVTIWLSSFELVDDDEEDTDNKE